MRTLRTEYDAHAALIEGAARRATLTAARTIPAARSMRAHQSARRTVRTMAQLIGATVAALVLLTIGATARAHHAHPVTVGVHLASTHLGKLEPGTSRTLATPGAYVVHPSGLTLGAYRNSARRWSVYGGRTWAIGERVSLTAGLVTGYPRAAVLPLVGVSVAMGDRGIGARAAWAPHPSHPVSLSLEARMPS